MVRDDRDWRPPRHEDRAAGLWQSGGLSAPPSCGHDSDRYIPRHSPQFPDAPTMTTDTAVETKPFQAEVAELLRLMVHSVYSETDIFLRELISNASDACDKLRYEAIANPDLVGDAPPKIRIIPDKKVGTLTIADTG